MRSRLIGFEPSVSLSREENNCELFLGEYVRRISRNGVITEGKHNPTLLARFPLTDIMESV
ncbi:hypothetical protein, partial [Eubacterium aggregans]|uniref:hypothetical protein n=1 Tax=Eubacterium aggregans TaxID=81409 RepID=UPI003F3FAB7E